jgi:hypothetical protein
MPGMVCIIWGILSWRWKRCEGAFYKIVYQEIMAYNFDEHKHRYAVWTAARAVQRSFAKTAEIINAINCTGLKQFSESEESITQEIYDGKQREWCNLIIDYFSKLDKKYNCSYGRASKIIAIYLKTAVIFPNKGETKKCLKIHPPIDSIILKSLAVKVKLNDLSNLTWTTFNENDYWKIVEKIRNSNLPFNWTLEEYWNLEQKRKGWAQAVQEMTKNGDDELIIPDVFEDEELED